MNTEFIRQYGHTWRVFSGLVQSFDPEAWLHTGRGAITPARLALHILQSAKYYLQDQAPLLFPSGTAFECQWHLAPESDLPSQEDIRAGIEEMQARTQQWFSEKDLAAANPAFPWAGETLFGVALFSLRHCLYHLGELSSLLNESKNGAVEDNYVKAIPA